MAGRRNAGRPIVRAGSVRSMTGMTESSGAERLVRFDRDRQTSARARGRLIWAFAIRDLRARFTATSLGLLWTLIVPLATVLIYSTVFSVIFRAQAPAMGNGHAGVFAAWFFVGLVTWNVFSQSTTGSMASILGMGGMLQKVAIPAYVPVLAAVVTIVIEKVIEAVVMMIFLLAYGNVSWTWLLYPFAFIGTGLFAAGLGYCLAVANVHLRDTSQVMAIILQLWFFLTPIMYPIAMIPESWHGIPLRTVLSVNPMTQLVGIARSLLYDLSLPSMRSVLYVLAWIAVSLGAAILVHRRLGQDVSEAI